MIINDAIKVKTDYLQFGNGFFSWQKGASMKSEQDKAIFFPSKNGKFREKQD
jgi:hypothetical protein